MVGDINLIPQEEVFVQKKTKAVKTSTYVALGVLVLSGLISLYLFLAIKNIKDQITVVDADINSLRSQISSLNQVEISARNLDKKFSILQTLFKERPRYSLLLEELKSRNPDELLVESMDVKTGQVTLSGVASNYIAIASFINNLMDKDFEGGNPLLKDVFTSVTLNSVSLEKSTNQVKFFIVVNFDESKLKK
ncbi:MAG: PilN domain-containing protein [Patescibacteria group bacterium]